MRKTYTTLAAHRKTKLAELREELSIEDRQLLILRVDRELPFEDIAIAFAGSPAALDAEARQREAGRLRQRFRIIKQRLIARVRDLRPEL